MTEEFFLIIFVNIVCPVLVHIICEKIKNHSSIGSRKSGQSSERRQINYSLDSASHLRGSLLIYTLYRIKPNLANEYDFNNISYLT